MTAEYQANPIDSTSTKVPIILDKPDDWWTWIGYIESIAKKWNIWKYLDPEDETNQEDEPKEPIKPVPAKQYGSMNQMEQFDWTQTRKDYEDARHLYEKESAGMMNIWNTIQSTVSLKHRHILKDKKLSERKRLVKLKKKLKPSQQSCIASLKLRFARLGAKKPNENMDRWLDEWESTIGECEEIGLAQLTGYVATSAFLDAIEPILPHYAAIRQEKLEEDNNLDVYDEINAFRKRWEKKSH